VADIVELLLADHAMLRRLLAEVETARRQPDDADSSNELPGRWEMLAALLDMHADAAEEIAFPALFGPTATGARDNARATHGDIREAVREGRLYPTGSGPWRLAVLAACAAAIEHIDDLESGALARFRHDAPMPVREALGRQWLAFVAPSTAGDTCHDPFCARKDL
jgi:Hemerythrin HHE cation binding domain